MKSTLKRELKVPETVAREPASFSVVIAMFVDFLLKFNAHCVYGSASVRNVGTKAFEGSADSNKYCFRIAADLSSSRGKLYSKLLDTSYQFIQRSKLLQRGVWKWHRVSQQSCTPDNFCGSLHQFGNLKYIYRIFTYA